MKGYCCSCGKKVRLTKTVLRPERYLIAGTHRCKGNKHYWCYKSSPRTGALYPTIQKTPRPNSFKRPNKNRRRTYRAIRTLKYDETYR